MRYSQWWPDAAKAWDEMTIKPSRIEEFRRLAQFAVDHKERYLAVEKLTGVPWSMIAVIHRREGDANFLTYLGNGQLLKNRTTVVPTGRGPFTGPNAFLNGCIDALKIDGLTAVRDWRVEKQMFYCVSFNGWGYDNGPHDVETGRHYPPMPSPYIFGGTNIQRPGKYIRDHVFKMYDQHGAELWDTQPGCAPLLWMIAQLDPSVTFTRETPPEAAPVA